MKILIAAFISLSLVFLLYQGCSENPDSTPGTNGGINNITGTGEENCLVCHTDKDMLQAAQMTPPPVAAGGGEG